MLHLDIGINLYAGETYRVGSGPLGPSISPVLGFTLLCAACSVSLMGFLAYLPSSSGSSAGNGLFKKLEFSEIPRREEINGDGVDGSRNRLETAVTRKIRAVDDNIIST